MAMKMARADKAAMEKYFEGLLDLYKHGKITRDAARNDCIQMLMMAAVDNEDLKARLNTSPEDRWADMIKEHGTN